MFRISIEGNGIVDVQVTKLSNKLLGKLSINHKAVIAIFLVIILCLLQSCSGVNRHGSTTPDRVIEQYLLALEDKDQNSMIRLFPENAVVVNLVQAKIAKVGGHKIRNRQIKYTKSKPTLWDVRVQGFYLDNSDTRRKFDETIVIEYQSKGQVKQYGGRWYLKI
jgi:hypothetical protein